MCRAAILAAVISGTATWAWRPPQEPPPAARLDQARNAMGGTQGLAGVNAAILRGHQRYRNRMYRLPGQTNPQEFLVDQVEIRFLLPDHYVRITTSQTGYQRRFGFAGSKVIGGSERLAASTLQFRKEDLGRLLFWIFLRTDSGYPMTLRGASATTLRFHEPDGTEVRLDLDPATHLPTRVAFSKRAQATSPTLAGKRFATVIEIGEYRQLGRLRLPHKLTEHEDGQFRRETEFVSMEINPPLTADSFVKR